MNTKLDTIYLLAFFVLAGITLLGFIWGIIWVVSIEKRLKRFFLGKRAQDLEDTIAALEDNIIKLNKVKENNDKELATINSKLKKSVRGLETIRFNPFPDQGGNQSFAVGLLDENGDGLVLSSLYSRERMSIFAKPVKSGKSEYDLTEEEANVLAKAKVK